MAEQLYVQGFGVLWQYTNARQTVVVVLFLGLKLDAPKQLCRSFSVSFCHGSTASSACKPDMFTVSHVVPVQVF
jgi:hypothetical protein